MSTWLNFASHIFIPPGAVIYIPFPTMRLRLFIVVCFLLLSLAGCARDQHKLPANHTLTRREKKAHLVKKFLKKLKKHEGLVRLVDGRTEYEGNVEIFHMGKWGSICDDEWDLREASVVCRQLGYNRPYRVTHSSMFGPAKRRFWMDNMYCTGDEPDLSSCRFDGWGANDCTASEAAGVICVDPEVEGSSTEVLSTTPASLPKRPLSRIKELSEEQLKVRLAGGRVPEEGRVEVKFGDSEWGLVCGDGWSFFEAMVVCRQLGLGYANDAIQTDFFGGNASAMVLSGVQCHGDEVDISHCLHQDFGQVSCPGKRENIAAVVCTKVLADLTIDHLEIMRTAHLEDRQLYFLQCAMEENCLASGAYKLQSDNSANWHLETRRLLRFTARIANIGTADFRPSIPKHMWEFHQCHMHYHSMEVFATFDVLDSKGVRVAEGHKASFCLEDNQCLPGVKPFYACANFGDQGISVNCSDIYRHNIDCQWVDISDLNPGLYTFKVSINPEFKVAEMTFDNNAAACTLLYTESFAHIYNCSIQRP